MNDRSIFDFAWPGASAPEGPFRHLLVMTVEGHEGISKPYAFRIELTRPKHLPDVDPGELVGSPATLRIRTGAKPAIRYVHGIIATAEELEAGPYGSWYLVELVPPTVRASMMRKSRIHLEKTLQEILTSTLERAAWGAHLTQAAAAPPADDDAEADTYTVPKATYAWRCLDTRRLTDAKARPYCVQYEESDFDFVARLLEEEGISYHFEHTGREVVFVMTDHDGGRPKLGQGQALATDLAGLDLVSIRSRSLLRVQSTSLSAYHWQKPQLDLLAVSPKQATALHDHEHTDRYHHQQETGVILAERRQERHDGERAAGVLHTRCALLGAGHVAAVEHSIERLAGDYLVVAIHHRGRARGEHGQAEGAKEPTYENSVEVQRVEPEHGSRYRPPLVSPQPRIRGSQTAMVTADPSAPTDELNVGGPEDVGCVRVRFHWDLEVERLAKEPSSCWVRVSQFFAGGNHGAMWHPRVGEEVIVDYIDGDPDRPIVVGRVYNGVKKPHENPTTRPTFSCIKSLTTPFDGNYNMIAFEDLAGSEEIIVHAARDWNEEILRNASRSVGQDDSLEVVGKQTESIGASQSVSVGGSQTLSVGGDQSIDVTGARSVHAASETILIDGERKTTSGGPQEYEAAAGFVFYTPASLKARADGPMSLSSPTVQIEGDAMIAQKAPLWVSTADGVAVLSSGGKVQVTAPSVGITGRSIIKATAPAVEVNATARAMVIAPTVIVSGDGSVKITGATVSISGSTVNIDGSGTVKVEGGSINLNC